MPHLLPEKRGLANTAGAVVGALVPEKVFVGDCVGLAVGTAVGVFVGAFVAVSLHTFRKLHICDGHQ